MSKVTLHFENMDPDKVDKGNFFQLVNPPRCTIYIQHRLLCLTSLNYSHGHCVVLFMDYIFTERGEKQRSYHC